MNDRIITVLLAALIALMVISLGHLAMPLLAFGWALGGGTTLALMGRIGLTVYQTPGGCRPYGRTA